MVVKCTLTGPTNITQACTNGGMPTSPFGPVLARLASTFRPFCGAGIIIFHDTLFQKSNFCQTLLFYSFLKMWRWMVRCEDRRAQVLRKHLQKGWIQDIANQYWNGPNSFPGKNGECCNSKCPVLQSNALFPQKKRRSPFPTFFCFQKILCSLEKKRDLIVVKLKVQLCIVFENHLKMSHFFFFWIFHLLVTLFDHKLQVFKNSPIWPFWGIFNELLFN